MSDDCYMDENVLLKGTLRVIVLNPRDRSPCGGQRIEVKGLRFV